jgi:prevent-host-death family protein
MYSGRMEINASHFKARCLRLLDQVERTGEEIVVLKRGRPVARVVPLHDEHPWLQLRGSGRFLGDPFEPVVELAEIDALR